MLVQAFEPAILHLPACCFSLAGCNRITNSGLEVLRPLVHLRRLNLYDCQRLADRAMAVLAPLSLHVLHLGFTRVRNEGLAHMSCLTALTELSLSGEAITSVGVMHLSVLTALQVSIHRVSVLGFGPCSSL